MEQPVIDPVDPCLIEAELTPARLLRRSNKAGNEIYTLTAHEAPMTMREIGRLREIAFRAAGGGTGKDCDIDEYDLMDPPCRQLIVWNPQTHEIIGGYRYIIGPDIRLRPDGTPRIATAHIFNLSPQFVSEYLPYTIELGRSFVRVEYQSSKAGAKAIYALDNLWDGLGALTVIHDSVRYLFGKVTMYPSFSRECRDMILYFMHRYFPDRDRLVTPITPLVTDCDNERLAALFPGPDYDDDYRALVHEVRALGVNIPPLVHAYMNLSRTMRIFGTAVNDEFGDVEETGILLAISEIYEHKKSRHIGTYVSQADKKAAGAES